MLAGSGHIAGVVNPPAKKKYQYWTGASAGKARPRRLAGEGEGASRLVVAGLARLAQGAEFGRSGRARPGGGKLKPIEDAPGSYVKVRD